jgi:hypothetical protein
VVPHTPHPLSIAACLWYTAAVPIEARSGCDQSFVELVSVG